MDINEMRNTARQISNAYRFGKNVTELVDALANQSSSLSNIEGKLTKLNLEIVDKTRNLEKLRKETVEQQKLNEAETAARKTAALKAAADFQDDFRARKDERNEVMRQMQFEHVEAAERYQTAIDKLQATKDSLTNDVFALKSRLEELKTMVGKI